MDSQLPSGSRSDNLTSKSFPVKRFTERYAPQFKQKVVDYVLGKRSENDANVGVSYVEASKQFGIHPTTISEWIQERKRQLEIKQLVSAREAFKVNEASSSSLDDSLRECMKNVRLISANDNNVVKVQATLYQELGCILESSLLATRAKKSSWMAIWWENVRKNRNFLENEERRLHGESYDAAADDMITSTAEEGDAAAASTVRIKVIQRIISEIIRLGHAEGHSNRNRKHLVYILQFAQFYFT